MSLNKWGQILKTFGMIGTHETRYLQEQHHLRALHPLNWIYFLIQLLSSVFIAIFTEHSLQELIIEITAGENWRLW